MDSATDVFTDDGFLDGRLQVLQPRKGFRAGVDSVFLAASIPARPGDAVFEAGTGPGVAALCLAARVPDLQITGVEENATYAMLAEKNAARNELGGALRVIRGDVRNVLKPGMAGLPEQNAFQHAFANPPYFEEGTVLEPRSALRSKAHVFGPEDLDIWVKAMTAMVVHRGTVTVIYPARFLDRLLAAFSTRLGGIRIAPLYPKAGAPASRAIVQGVKGSRKPVQLLPGMILHDVTGDFTVPARRILRNGDPFPMS